MKKSGRDKKYLSDFYSVLAKCLHYKIIYHNKKKRRLRKHVDTKAKVLNKERE